MDIYLGNLDASDIESRCGVTFPIELQNVHDAMIAAAAEYQDSEVK